MPRVAEPTLCDFAALPCLRGDQHVAELLEQLHALPEAGGSGLIVDNDVHR
jgi:hypothetical protein